MSEDCLNLNVYTPSVDGQRPVVVWIHGGAFVSGSSACAMYDGSSFARDGVVFVSINYRLHALGFLYLDELFGVPGSGNAGLLDQVAALEWVRDNITAFGGDPGRVTVLGESAGAMSIGTLLAVDSAHGLFHRAILQSGAAHHTLTTESAQRVTRRVLEAVRVEPGDLAALRAVPAETLMGVAQQMAFMEAEQLLGGENAAVRTVFAPVIDGHVLPRRAYEMIAAGSSDGVDVLIGTCADEYRVFIWGMPEPLRSMVPRPATGDYFTGTSPSADDVVKVYAQDREGLDDLDLAVAIAGDAIFGIPAVRLADAKVARGDGVWMQELAWKTPVLDGSLGACHALDIPFVFESLDHPGLLGTNPPISVAHDMHGACVRFILTGDPNGGQLPQWNRYDPTSRSVMTHDLEPSLVNDPRAHEREMWDGVW
jgi:para-nitrobenzyl esterase